MLLSGCVGWAGGPDDGSRRNTISGKATIHIGGYSFPLSGGRIVVSGTYSGTTHTSRDGTYSYSRMAAGRHKVTLRALHGTYEETVFLEDGRGRPHILNWPLRPRGLDSETFFHLSGLKRLYVDDRDGFPSDFGTLVRWEKSTVRVHFDELGAPGRLPSGTVERYMSELRRWEGYLDYRVNFIRWNDPQSADIVVYWVPEGFLHDHAGIARHVAFYTNGALKRVEIEIDVAYANFPGLWEHEFAHAMGVDHLPDRASVLYPYLLHGQRTTLSTFELAHVRLMYDIPSGQQLRRSAYGALIGSGGWESSEFSEWSVEETTPGEASQSVESGWLGAERSDSLAWSRGESAVDAIGSNELAESIKFDEAAESIESVESIDAETAVGRREHILYIDESLLNDWLTDGFLHPDAI